MEGNFIPLAEEFENVLENDIVLKAYIPEIDVILKRRDKLGVIVDYKKAGLKAKINKYAEAAGYIREISEANDIYLNTIFNKLVENIFTEKNEYSNWNTIYSLTRILVTELVNVGYSPEYISHEMRKTFLDNRIKVKCEERLLIDFFSKFTFESKSYQVILGINAETAKILHYLKDITVKEPTIELRKQLNLNHKGDCIVEFVSAYQKDYDVLYELLEEYPLLQYRMENFSKKIFTDSKSVYEELIRHKQKIRWQIMRIYRNRNMIVHNGEHMPYLDIILGNLHYYIDAMFDLLIEYYHLGIKKNQYIFYHVQKEEVRYWNILGLDEKGKKSHLKK